ncbi:hypothetical protein SY88_14155 [Clostridiales bacterium PH28_bin88]|nr:hypothetical protein SY88_14155 [Clostridiales bacterium PH28_bin88]
MARPLFKSAIPSLGGAKATMPYYSFRGYNQMAYPPEELMLPTRRNYGATAFMTYAQMQAADTALKMNHFRSSDGGAAGAWGSD